MVLQKGATENEGTQNVYDDDLPIYVSPNKLNHAIILFFNYNILYFY